MTVLAVFCALLGIAALCQAYYIVYMVPYNAYLKEQARYVEMKSMYGTADDRDGAKESEEAPHPSPETPMV